MASSVFDPMQAGMQRNNFIQCANILRYMVSQAFGLPVEYL